MGKGSFCLPLAGPHRRQRDLGLVYSSWKTTGSKDNHVLVVFLGDVGPKDEKGVVSGMHVMARTQPPTLGFKMEV